MNRGVVLLSPHLVEALMTGKEINSEPPELPMDSKLVNMWVDQWTGELCMMFDHHTFPHTKEGAHPPVIASLGIHGTMRSIE